MNWNMNMFYEDCGKNSSKICVRRVMGVMGFIASIVFVAVGLIHDALQLLMMLSAALLGVTTVDKFVKNNNNVCET